MDDSGVIIEVIDPMTTGELPSGIKKYEGFICPGFVNTHCHLELSHLKGKFPEKTGLVGFIDQMRLGRGGELIHESILKADEEMQANGIVAVADISNSPDTIDIKRNSQLYYHTFVEIFDVNPGRAEKVFEDGLNLMQKFTDLELSASIVPHAPYTVSSKLLSLLSRYYFSKLQLSTIHNQETEDEDALFHSQSGDIFDFLIGLNPANTESIHKSNSSLEYILDHLHHFEKLLFVHNTFTKEEHIKEAQEFSDDIYWCMCPNANQYIENTLPDIELFRKNNCRMTIGTDSYASNRSLSVLDEIKTISTHFPKIPLNELLKWATLNGSAFLGKDDVYGSLERGKCPGIVLIENVDLTALKLKSDSVSRRIDK